MITLDVMLEDVNTIKEFVNIAAKYPFDIDFISDDYVVDAKSIVGIFSLDLSKPVSLEVHTDKKEASIFLEEIDKYIIK